MSRLPRLCVPSIPLHIIQRGNNRQMCFAAEKDFAAYAHWLKVYSLKYQVAIHAWVFMTNHVHLLVTPQTRDGVSSMMQSLGRQYVRYFNHTYGRTGTLWEGRYKSCLIDAENYFLHCQRYIELNPVRAKIVKHPADYHWSSYAANGNGIDVQMHTPHAVYLSLGKNLQECSKAYRHLFSGRLDEHFINEIRKVSKQGLVLGNEKFKNEMAQLTGCRVAELRRGPKSK